MKRIKLTGPMLIALFALGAFASAGAFAENPTILNSAGKVPSGAEPLKFESKSTTGTETILTGTKGKETPCHKAKNKGEFTSQDAGTLLIEFEGCEVGLGSGVLCSGVDDKTAGVILTKLNAQLVDVLISGTLDLGIWLEPKNDAGTGDVEFVCGGVVTAKFLGAFIGVVDNKGGTLLTAKEGEEGKTEEVKVLWKQSTTGEQEITTCMTLVALCGEKEANKFLLLADFGKGHELSSERVDAELFNFTGKTIKVLF
jgi:hypothetical protein